jgi:NADH-quinone oxidoreductase subunit M
VFEVLIENILPITAFLPLLGMALILLTPRDYKDVIKQTAFWCSIITFAVSLVIWFQFKNIADLQMQVKWDWIIINFGDFSAPISFIFGVDGISILLVMLTTFITPLAILGSWNSIKDRIKEYYALFMLLEVGMIGVFLAGDLFLFYVFWEVMLIPMYLLIGIWGGKERIYASIKFVLFTMFGSLLMLVAIIFLVFYSGANTFEIAAITSYLLANPLATEAQIWLFVAFFLAFAIKVPLFPFHTWLPDAHVQAPTAGSVILAGVLLKMGTYGFVRFCIPMFPEAAVKAIPTIVILSIIGIIYGALVAMVQPDVKKLVAYSSVAHMGFVMMGIFALNMQGLQGGMLQMINHGLSTGALFLIVGMLYERRHTRQIADYGGISKIMPVFAVFFMVITLSSIGLPGMNGFVGEFLTMLGVYKLHWGYALAAVPGVILAAVYMLWMYQRVMFGKVTNEENSKLKDINWREMACLIPIVVFVFWIGVYPNTFLEKMEPSLEKLISQVGPEMKKEYSDYDPGLAKAEAAKTELEEAEDHDDNGHSHSDETEKGEE